MVLFGSKRRNEGPTRKICIKIHYDRRMGFIRLLITEIFM